MANAFEYQPLNALQRFGAALQGQNDILMKDRQQSALASIANAIQNGELSPQDASQQIASITGDPSALVKIAEFQQQQAGRQRLAEMMQQEPNLDMTNPQTVARLTASGVPSSVVSDMLQAQGNAVQAGGGATGALIQQLMKATGMTFPQALQAVQTGYRQNTALTPEGVVQPLAGATDTLSALDMAKEAGKQQAKQEYQPATERMIAEAKQGVEQQGKRLDEAKKTGNSFDVMASAFPLLNVAGGGIWGNITATAKQWANISDAQTQANNKLATLSGWLMSNVPRMEGPQSNFDVENYKGMAADIGNIDIPIGDRQAKLQELWKLQEKYSALNPNLKLRPRPWEQQPSIPSISMEELTAPQLKENIAPPSMDTGSEGIKITEPSTGQWGIRRVK